MKNRLEAINNYIIIFPNPILIFLEGSIFFFFSYIGLNTGLFCCNKKIFFMEKIYICLNHFTLIIIHIKIIYIIYMSLFINLKYIKFYKNSL